ncbi:unnamed protein product [Prunus armeniaca]|uniref:Uncharacterized protein n=1 Tax=Prunus armeniaca TaxID=36596 RepID=A0A6J5X5H2_PRUAR|nr:unnamed protein product [Prunus armeniaca]CAB4278660.1 unnamed protein product [Prunus armeniaca]CAB4309069.1 unnamed protein product [Prunus armeniaca]CAB4309079.1 unnamed protein product [Prunus armeniaca]
MKNKCFVAFEVVGERRVGAERFSIRSYPITATPHGAGVGNVVLPGVGIDNLLRALRARECLCQPREAHHSPTSVGDDGLAFEFTLAWGCPRLCFCVGSTATKPSQCTGTSGMAFGGVDEEASQLLATRTHVVTMGGLWVNFSLGLSSVMLLCWEYGHQTFSMHEYVEDGFRRSS